MRGRAGPVTEISVFATDISVIGIKIFPYKHSSLVTGMKLFKQNNVALTTYRPKWRNFGLVCISSLVVYELALLVKLWQWRTIKVYVPPFWLFFLNSLWLTGLKSPIWTHHRIRPRPGSYEEALSCDYLRLFCEQERLCCCVLVYISRNKSKTGPEWQVFSV